MIYGLVKRGNFRENIFPILVFGTLFAGVVGLAGHLYNNYRKNMDFLRNPSETKEYSVKPNENWENIINESVPVNIRNSVDARTLREIITREINDRNNSKLQTGEIVKIPLYDGKD